MEKSVLLLSDFKIPQKDLSFILKSAQRDTQKLNPQLRFSYGGVYETSEPRIWPYNEIELHATALRLNYLDPHLVGLFIDKQLVDETSKWPLTGGVYCGGKKVFFVSCREKILERLDVEAYYGSLMHEIGESEGLGHHSDKPKCFMNTPSLPSPKEVFPSEFCSVCLTKVKKIKQKFT
jgi:hypothetical protein